MHETHKLVLNNELPRLHLEQVTLNSLLRFVTIVFKFESWPSFEKASLSFNGHTIFLL